jgi:hypothetical protein
MGCGVTQEALDFGRDHRVSEAMRSVLRILNDATDSLGLLQVAGACGCRTQDLSDALSGRPGRYFRLEWLLGLMDLADTPLRQRIAAVLVGWCGFGVTAAKPLTPAEKLARLEAKVLSKFGTAGAELVEEVKRSA